MGRYLNIVQESLKDISAEETRKDPTRSQNNRINMVSDQNGSPNNMRDFVKSHPFSYNNGGEVSDESGNRIGTSHSLPSGHEVHISDKGTWVHSKNGEEVNTGFGRKSLSDHLHSWHNVSK